MRSAWPSQMSTSTGLLQGFSEINGFGQLPERYQAIKALRSELLGYAEILCRDASLARQAMDEAFVHAFRTVRTFDDRSGLRAWFKEIVAKRCHRARLDQSERSLIGYGEVAA